MRLHVWSAASWSRSGSRGGRRGREAAGGKVKLRTDGARAESKRETDILLQIFKLHDLCHRKISSGLRHLASVPVIWKCVFWRFLPFCVFRPGVMQKEEAKDGRRFRTVRSMSSLTNPWRHHGDVSCFCTRTWNRGPFIWFFINNTFAWLQIWTFALLFYYFCKTKYELMLYLGRLKPYTCKRITTLQSSRYKSRVLQWSTFQERQTW